MLSIRISFDQSIGIDCAVATAARFSTKDSAVFGMIPTQIIRRKIAQ